MKKNLLFIVLLLFGSTLFAQSIKLHIVDANKEPIVGATVILEGTKFASLTDIMGNVTFNNLSPIKYKVKIALLGFKPMYQILEPNTTGTVLNFTLKEDSKELTDVVVVGYGTKTKREVTGSIARISAKELNDLPVQSFESALQAKLPGVQVTTGSGLAGSSAKVVIRGISSISAGGDPLYVVDGIPITQDFFINSNAGAMNNNPLAVINPDDIESIEVLKDAAAAIYGSRGSNGVILITTKTAKKGVNFSYTGSVGVSNPTALPNMLNTDQYLQLYQEAWENDGKTGLATLPNNISWDDARKTNTDWVDLTTQTGIKHSHNVTLSKGTNKYSILGSLSYSNNESYLVGNSYNRTSFRINGDYAITKNIKATVNSSLSRGVNHRINAAWSGGLGSAMSTALPIFPVYNPDGTFYQGGDNPVRVQELKEWQAVENRAINGIGLEVKLTDQLIATGNVNMDYMDLKDDQHNPKELLNSIHVGDASRFWVTVKNYNYFAHLKYKVKLPTIHKLTIMGGYEFQKSKTHSSNYYATSMQGGFQEENAKVVDSLYSYTLTKNPPKESKFNSVFSRFSYGFNNKIFLETTLRMDGSSKFGKNYGFGFFPSYSASWLITEERFLSKFSALSLLKLRASYGKSGNANIDENSRFFIFANNATGYNGNPITYPTNYGNDDLRWETSWTSNIGVDVGFLNDRIIFTAEYYVRNTSDCLMQLALPPSTGIESYYANVGKIQNKGYEFSITSRNIDRTFKWTTLFNIATNRNEVVSTGLYTSDAVGGGTNDTRVVVGSPIGTNYLVRFSHVDAATGRPVYLDKDGNETFTWDPKDRVVAGNVLPDATGGLNNNFSYKNWDLSVLFNFVLGGDIYESSAKRQLGVVTNWNMREDIFDRWQKPGDIAAFPKLTLETSTYGSTTPWINTTMFLHDGTFARLRNVTIGYRVPKQKLVKYKIASMKIALIGTNLLTFTKYPGLDPEIARDFDNVTDRNMSPNITYLTSPQEKTYSMQVSLTF